MSGVCILIDIKSTSQFSAVFEMLLCAIGRTAIKSQNICKIELNFCNVQHLCAIDLRNTRPEEAKTRKPIDRTTKASRAHIDLHGDSNRRSTSCNCRLTFSLADTQSLSYRSISISFCLLALFFRCLRLSVVATFFPSSILNVAVVFTIHILSFADLSVCRSAYLSSNANRLPHISYAATLQYRLQSQSLAHPFQ